MIKNQKIMFLNSNEHLKRELNKLYSIKIEYLDFRKESDLKNSKTINGSRLFIAYYINKIRLIDNF